MGYYVYRVVEIKLMDLKGKFDHLNDIDVEKEGIKEGDCVRIYYDNDKEYMRYDGNKFVPISYDDVPRKWFLAKYYAPTDKGCGDGKAYDGCEIGKSTFYCNNGGLVRDEFLSDYWGDKYGLINRGWPTDSGKEAKEVLKEFDDEYIFGKTYVTLSEWMALYERLLESYKSKLNEKALKNVTELNKRFDYLENLVKHCSGRYDSKDYSLKREVEEDEENEFEYNDFLNDAWDKYIAAYDEYSLIYNLVDKLVYGVIEDNVRITYFIG